jgi:hypothetical protein
MSGHSRSATAHPGIRPPGCQARQAATATGYTNRRVIRRILRSRGGSSVAGPGHEDIQLRTGPCHRLSRRLIRDEPRRCPTTPLPELGTG